MTRSAWMLCALAATTVIGMCAPSNGEDSGVYGDGHTTVVRNGNSVSVVTQSGDPAKAEVEVEKEPGRTTIIRRSGGNTAVVTQSSRPEDLPPELLRPWPLEMPRR